jgi:hypothetical protein
LTTNEPQLGRGEGWILFAGIMLVVAGILNSIWGIAAIDDSAYWGKAGWMVFVIVVPFLGVFLYLIGQRDEMRNRNLAQARSETEAFHEYVRDTAGGPARRSPRRRSCSTRTRSPRRSSTSSTRRRWPEPSDVDPNADRRRGALTRARGQEAVGPCPRRRRPTAT